MLAAIPSAVTVTISHSFANRRSSGSEQRVVRPGSRGTMPPARAWFCLLENEGLPVKRAFSVLLSSRGPASSSPGERGGRRRGSRPLLPGRPRLPGRPQCSPLGACAPRGPPGFAPVPSRCGGRRPPRPAAPAPARRPPPRAGAAFSSGLPRPRARRGGQPGLAPQAGHGPPRSHLNRSRGRRRVAAAAPPPPQPAEPRPRPSPLI